MRSGPLTQQFYDLVILDLLEAVVEAAHGIEFRIDDKGVDLRARGLDAVESRTGCNRDGYRNFAGFALLRGLYRNLHR